MSPKNKPCPCCSRLKYKKCCAIYHQGALPKSALALMRSRYSAYALGNSLYIIATTHRENPDYTTDRESWRASIDLFCEQTDFQNLKIVEFVGGDVEAFVSFEATLSSGILSEKSRFLRVDGKWLYVDGVMASLPS